MLEEIGRTLREAREAKGLSLEEVQADTKIRRKYLQALEDGREDEFPAEVYLRGFLRSYANYLGLDGLALVEEYRRTREEQMDEQEEARVEDDEVTVADRLIVRPVVVVVLVGLILLAGTFLGLRYWPTTTTADEELPGPAAENAQVLAPEQQEEASQEPAPDTPPPTPRPRLEMFSDNDKESVYYVTGSEAVELSIAARGRCWLEVMVDGEVVTPPSGIILEEGEARTWNGHDRIFFRAGNPTVLDVTVNGIPLDLNAQQGIPKNFVFILKRD